MSRNAYSVGVLEEDSFGLQEDAPREQDLDAKKKALDAREQELNKKAQDLEKNAANGGKTKNWPHPKFALCHHDIAGDIPMEHQKTMKMFYFLWMFGSIALLLNFVIALGLWIAPNPDDVAIWTPFMAFVYLVASTILSWKLWYRSIYSAYAKKKTMKWVFFFLCIGLYMLWLAFLTLGIGGSGTLGFMTMVDLLFRGGSPKGWGIMCLINTIAFAANLLLALFLTRQAHSFYRGGSPRGDSGVGFAKDFAGV